jgi:MinD-like ATPase involved in chromosome partitioning or flagellar assembly
VCARRHSADDDRPEGLADALARWDTEQGWMRATPGPGPGAEHVPPPESAPPPPGPTSWNVPAPPTAAGPPSANWPEPPARRLPPPPPAPDSWEAVLSAEPQPSRSADPWATSDAGSPEDPEQELWTPPQEPVYGRRSDTSTGAGAVDAGSHLPSPDWPPVPGAAPVPPSAPATGSSSWPNDPAADTSWSETRSDGAPAPSWSAEPPAAGATPPAADRPWSPTPDARVDLGSSGWPAPDRPPADGGEPGTVRWPVMDERSPNNPDDVGPESPGSGAGHSSWDLSGRGAWSSTGSSAWSPQPVTGSGAEQSAPRLAGGAGAADEAGPRSWSTPGNDDDAASWAPPSVPVEPQAAGQGGSDTGFSAWSSPAHDPAPWTPPSPDVPGAAAAPDLSDDEWLAELRGGPSESSGRPGGSASSPPAPPTWTMGPSSETHPVTPERADTGPAAQSSGHEVRSLSGAGRSLADLPAAGAAAAPASARRPVAAGDRTAVLSAPVEHPAVTEAFGPRPSVQLSTPDSAAAARAEAGSGPAWAADSGRPDDRSSGWSVDPSPTGERPAPEARSGDRPTPAGNDANTGWATDQYAVRAGFDPRTGFTASTQPSADPPRADRPQDDWSYGAPMADRPMTDADRTRRWSPDLTADEDPAGVHGMRTGPGSPAGPDSMPRVEMSSAPGGATRADDDADRRPPADRQAARGSFPSSPPITQDTDSEASPPALDPPDAVQDRDTGSHRAQDDAEADSAASSGSVSGDHDRRTAEPAELGAPTGPAFGAAVAEHQDEWSSGPGVPGSAAGASHGPGVRGIVHSGVAPSNGALPGPEAAGVSGQQPEPGISAGEPERGAHEPAAPQESPQDADGSEGPDSPASSVGAVAFPTPAPQGPGALDRDVTQSISGSQHQDGSPRNGNSPDTGPQSTEAPAPDPWGHGTGPAQPDFGSPSLGGPPEPRPTPVGYGTGAPQWRADAPAGPDETGRHGGGERWRPDAPIPSGQGGYGDGAAQWRTDVPAATDQGDGATRWRPDSPVEPDRSDDAPQWTPDAPAGSVRGDDVPQRPDVPVSPAQAGAGDRPAQWRSDAPASPGQAGDGDRSEPWRPDAPAGSGQAGEGDRPAQWRPDAPTSADQGGGAPQWGSAAPAQPGQGGGVPQRRTDAPAMPAPGDGVPQWRADTPIGPASHGDRAEEWRAAAPAGAGQGDQRVAAQWRDAPQAIPPNGDGPGSGARNGPATGGPGQGSGRPDTNMPPHSGPGGPRPDPGAQYGGPGGQGFGGPDPGLSQYGGPGRIPGGPDAGGPGQAGFGAPSAGHGDFGGPGQAGFGAPTAGYGDFGGHSHGQDPGRPVGPGSPGGNGPGGNGPVPAAPTVDQLTAQSLLRERRPTPHGGWRRAVYTLTAHTLNPGQSHDDRRRQELIQRASVPVPGCYRIAVISLKGGVGKTTTTVTLGATLASLRGDRVIAVDANPDRGTLSGKIPLETVATVRNLLNDVEDIQHYFDVRRYTSQSADRLEVLASESDPAVSTAFSESDYRTVAAVLERFYNIVLTDCGTGLLHSAMAGVLDLADQIVLVSSGSVDGARSASATLDWLEAHGRGELVRNSVAVINSVRPKSGGVDLDRLEAHFAARCRAVTRIPYDPHLEEGAEVDLGELSAQSRAALLELAANVADAFPRDPRAMRPPAHQPPDRP